MMVALGGGRGEITPDEIDSPSARDSESSQGGWGRVVRGICFVCCCLVVETETEGTEGRR